MSRPSSIVPCLTWVSRGVSKGTPDKVQLDKEELKKLIEDAQEDLNDIEDSDESNSDSDEENMEEEGAAASVKESKKEKKKTKRAMLQKGKSEDVDDIVNKYGLDDYDDDDDDEKPGSSQWKGMGDIANYASNADDPHITIKNDADSDDEDMEIKPTDNLLINGRCEGDMSVLEVYVYNEDSSQLYVHHDYLLPSFPLVVEWLNFDGYDRGPGNMLALGTMDPEIQIWDLDVMESVGPTLTLGAQTKTKKKKMKKKQKESVTGHTQAVLDLSWNHKVRHVLASASADTVVGLWDLQEGKMVSSFTQHTKEVQCCKWHPEEEQMLLTGSFDHTVKVVDCRQPDACHKSWSVQGEVEKAIWNGHNPIQFLACTDEGMVYCMDMRQEKPVFSLSAHNKSVSGICLSSEIAGLMVTTSEDHTMKIWDIQGNKVSHVFSKNLHMSELHCISSCPDAPFVVAIGGCRREPKVWDIRESAAVRQQFLNRMSSKLAKECEGDSGDVKEDDEEVAEAMDGLQMGDDEEEEEEMAAKQASVQAPSKKKKKKKKAKNL